MCYRVQYQSEVQLMCELTDMEHTYYVFHFLTSKDMTSSLIRSYTILEHYEITTM